MLTSPLPIPNRLLASVLRSDYQRLEQHLELTELKGGQILHEPGDLIRHVYFPNDSLVSILVRVDTKESLAVSLVAHEGMVGVASALGVCTSPVRTTVQSAGSAMRVTAAHFRKVLKSSLSLQKEVNLYSHALMNQIAQTAACNRFHRIEARLARWLLMTRDRISSDHFYLTHEHLGDLLGVRRVGVTEAAQALRLKKLIDYSRGHIDILDGAGLEAAACSCYQAVKAT